MTSNPTVSLIQPFTFSQSSLQDYADCARRFQLRYIEQLNWPAVESEPVAENERRQIEGQLFHRLVQQHLLGIPVDRLAKLANTPDLERWWEHYIKSDMGISGYEKHTELSLSSPIGENRLLAKYDLIAVKPGEKAIIFDWKTYAKRPRNDWLAARWQTRVYRATLVQAGAHLNNGKAFQPEQIEMIYWFADYPNDPARFPYDSKQFKRDWDGITKLTTEITSASAHPKTDDEPRCRFCAFRSYCNRGTTAGLIDEAEAEMEAEEFFDVNFEQIGEIAF